MAQKLPFLYFSVISSYFRRPTWGGRFCIFFVIFSYFRDSGVFGALSHPREIVTKGGFCKKGGFCRHQRCALDGREWDTVSVRESPSKFFISHRTASRKLPRFRRSMEKTICRGFPVRASSPTSLWLPSDTKTSAKIIPVCRRRGGGTKGIGTTRYFLFCSGHLLVTICHFFVTFFAYPLLHPPFLRQGDNSLRIICRNFEGSLKSPEQERLFQESRGKFAISANIHPKNLPRIRNSCEQVFLNNFRSFLTRSTNLRKTEKFARNSSKKFV